jgi:hypothetical protein
MNKDVAHMKRVLQAGIGSFAAFALVACGGYGSPPAQAPAGAAGGTNVVGSGSLGLSQMSFADVLARGYLTQRCSSDATPGYAHCSGYVLTSSGKQAIAREASSARRSTLAASLPVGADPATYQAGYGLTAASASMGVGKTVGIVVFGHITSLESDLAVYRQQYGLRACTKANGCLREVDQLGGTNYPTLPALSFWGREFNIDTDIISAICPLCNILVVEAKTASMADLSVAENTAAALGANAIANSWGASETGMGSYASAFNHPGIPITAAAGTGPGTFEGYSSVQEVPAAYSTVIAVGGTALVPGNPQLPVTQWNDKSGHGNTLTDTTNQPPLINSAALNGKNTINMVALGQELSTSANVGVSGGADRTLITVQYNNLISTGTHSSGEAFGIDYGSSQSGITLPYQWADDNFISSSTALYSSLINTWTINVGERSFGSTSGYANGTQVGSAIVSATNTVPQPLTIGTQTPGGGVVESVQELGQFAEILYYSNGLSLANRQKVEGYLACKWGLQSRLPSFHPYRSTCPAGFTPASLGSLSAWYDADDATTITTPPARIPTPSTRGWFDALWMPIISGCSTLVAKPAWQHDVGCAKRTVSDISFAISAQAVYSTFPDPSGATGWWTFYGTSTTAPAIAAIAAMAGTIANDASFLYTPTGLANLNLVTVDDFSANALPNADGTCPAVPGNWSTGILQNFSYLRRKSSGGGLPAYLCSSVGGYSAPTGNGTPNGIGAFLLAGCPVVVGTPNPHPTENAKGTNPCGTS